MIAKTNTEIAQNCDILICFSNTPTINKKFVSQMSNDFDDIDDGPTDKEMFEEDFEEVVESFNIDKSKYH